QYLWLTLGRRRRRIGIFHVARKRNNKPDMRVIGTDRIGELVSHLISFRHLTGGRITRDDKINFYVLGPPGASRISTVCNESVLRHKFPGDVVYMIPEPRWRDHQNVVQRLAQRPNRHRDNNQADDG